MPATLHQYAVDVVWNGGRDGGGEVRPETSGVKIPLAVGPEFQGPGGGSNPEELLAAAIAGCYAMTFGIIAANRKLPVIKLTAKVIGEVEHNGPQITYKGVVIKPEIVLSAEATDEQVALTKDMAHKADSYCIITNAVRGKLDIAVEPHITKE